MIVLPNVNILYLRVCARRVKLHTLTWKEIPATRQVEVDTGLGIRLEGINHVKSRITASGLGAGEHDSVPVLN